MLVSHRFKFIFTKTAKTGGTSVESFFEPYCMPDGHWQEKHFRDEYVSPTGIIGFRGYPEENHNPTWFNHMPARQIKDSIGDKIWNEYFKFTVIRNPFDKLVSTFQMFARRQNLLFKDNSEEIQQFKNWLKKQKSTDRNLYFIGPSVAVDFFIRFESLIEDIQTVHHKLGIPLPDRKLPEFKKGERHFRLSVEEYFDQEAEDVTRKMFEWEIKKFEYDLPVSAIQPKA